MTNIIPIITSLLLLWDDTNNVRSTIDGYNVYVYSEDNSQKTNHYFIQTNSFLITNLVPGRRYSFGVSVAGKSGLSSPTKTLSTNIPLPLFQVYYAPILTSHDYGKTWQTNQVFQWTNSIDTTQSTLFRAGGLFYWNPLADTNIIPRTINRSKATINYPAPPMPTP